MATWEDVRDFPEHSLEVKQDFKGRGMLAPLKMCKTLHLMKHKSQKLFMMIFLFLLLGH